MYTIEVGYLYTAVCTEMVCVYCALAHTPIVCHHHVMNQLRSLYTPRQLEQMERVAIFLSDIDKPLLDVKENSVPNRQQLDTTEGTESKA